MALGDGHPFMVDHGTMAPWHHGISAMAQVGKGKVDTQETWNSQLVGGFPLIPRCVCVCV